MTDYLMVPDFDRLVTHKDRAPKFIRLHLRFLDDYDFSIGIDEEDQLYLIKIWMYAAAHRNKVPNDFKFMGRTFHASKQVRLARYVELGWLVPYVEPEVIEHTKAPQPKRFVLAYPVVGDEKRFFLTERKFGQMFSTYGKVIDVMFHLKDARQWCMDNPLKRKTSRGMVRFLGAWLRRTVDNGTGRPPKTLKQTQAEIDRMNAARQADNNQKRRHERHDGGSENGGPVAVGDVIDDTKVAMP